MARKEFLDYVWKYCIEPQLGYSFSLNHTLPYSVIAVQEMNLATRWNPLYWQCACLCVNAGNYVGDMSEDNADEDIEDNAVITIDESQEVSLEDAKKTKRVAPNYGKISKAISDAQLSGVNIELPDINEAEIDFVPDVKNNSILYSLQAINVVGDELLERILNNRPYSSPMDFYIRVEPTQAQMIGLIKAGSFDTLCAKPRGVIMNEFLQYLADQEIELKEKLTTVQLKKAIALKMPELRGYLEGVRVYKYKQYIDVYQADKATKRYILSDEACIKFFNTYIKDRLSLTKDEYSYLPDDKIAIKMLAFKKVSDDMMKPLMEYFNTLEGRTAYRNILQLDYINQLMTKYCSGSVSKWEMDTMSFYYSGHELKNMNNGMYNTRNFNDLPEKATDSKMCSIAGTITNVNNAKHIVSILTNYGVVDVKFFGGHYTQFNQKISEIDPETKKKIVIDDSWFKRGNKIIVFGQRRENMFTAKNCRDSGYNRIVGLIDSVNVDGTLNIHYTRNKKGRSA